MNPRLKRLTLSCSRVIERLHARWKQHDYRRPRKMILYKNKEGALCNEDGRPILAGDLVPGQEFTMAELQ